jgi:2-polyprenyl-6-hydroxyphenyl methylase/3-demethylubiquinone-9 3-methyltransferase
MSKLRWKIAQAAEIRWWQSYLGKKSKPDYLRWKGDYWRNLLAKINVELQSGDRILDAGCGPAGIFMIFSGYDVDALDPLLEDYEDKLEHFDPGEYPWTTFHAVSLEDYKTKVIYDKVFCLNAINHVADLDRCFDQLLRLTKIGGRLIVSIDAHNHQWLKKIFRLIPGDILHPHQYDLQEYEGMLTTRGCQIEQRLLIDEARIFNYYTLIARRVE